MLLNWRASGLFLLAAALLAVAVLAAPSATASQAATPAAERPAWHSLPLVNSATGESFTLADFAGKTVYVEPMATWCTNCRQQMSVIRDEVLGQVDPEQVVFVGLSVETTLSPEELAAYTATHSFTWTFAVMTPEILEGLAGQFGRSVANPPAVPSFVISPDGSTSDLSTGFHTGTAVLERLAAASTMQP
ncbi:MAG: peroxiredoxin family protein [Chloroflexota bacterium]